MARGDQHIRNIDSFSSHDFTRIRNVALWPDRTQARRVQGEQIACTCRLFAVRREIHLCIFASIGFAFSLVNINVDQ